MSSAQSLAWSLRVVKSLRLSKRLTLRHLAMIGDPVARRSLAR